MWWNANVKKQNANGMNVKKNSECTLHSSESKNKNRFETAECDGMLWVHLECKKRGKECSISR